MKKVKIEMKPTPRGFMKGEFKDLYGSECSIQESSLATDDAIWLGVNDAKPEIMISDARKLGMDIPGDNGWMAYPIPEQVCFTTRMHLNKEQVEQLLPLLKKFVKTGSLR